MEKGSSDAFEKVLSHDSSIEGQTRRIVTMQNGNKKCNCEDAAIIIVILTLYSFDCNCNPCFVSVELRPDLFLYKYRYLSWKQTVIQLYFDWIGTANVREVLEPSGDFLYIRFARSSLWTEKLKTGPSVVSSMPNLPEGTASVEQNAPHLLCGQ